MPPALLFALFAACAIALLSFGVRATFGLFMEPIGRDSSISRSSFALAIAIQNICWGIGQPLAGILADRSGARTVLLAGAAACALGILGMVFATSPLELDLTAGVLTGLGMGGASFITVLAALGRLMPENLRSWALGLATAAGSLGQFVIVPIAQATIEAAGWRAGAWAIAAAISLILPLSWWIRGDRTAPAPGLREAPAALTGDVVRTAVVHPSYLLLVAGFFVCGFQLAFVTTHFPSYVRTLGLPAQLASWAIALIGLFNVAGAYLAGVWGARSSKKNLLVAIYFGRALVIAVLLLLAPSTFGVLVFGAAMGLLWLSTVPLTSGLVATFFGTRHMATLFGIVFLGHQVGAFLGVWLGAAVYARTGSYDAIWWLCIVLSLVAGLVNLPIREQASARYLRLVAA